MPLWAPSGGWWPSPNDLWEKSSPQPQGGGSCLETFGAACCLLLDCSVGQLGEGTGDGGPAKPFGAPDVASLRGIRQKGMGGRVGNVLTLLEAWGRRLFVHSKAKALSGRSFEMEGFAEIWTASKRNKSSQMSRSQFIHKFRFLFYCPSHLVLFSVLFPFLRLDSLKRC